MTDNTIGTLAVEVVLDTSQVPAESAKVKTEVNSMKAPLVGLGAQAQVTGTQVKTSFTGMGVAATGANTKLKAFSLTGKMLAPILKSMGVPAASIAPAFAATGTAAVGATPGVAALGVAMAAALAPIVAITLAITAVTMALDHFKRQAAERRDFENKAGYFDSVFGDLEGSRKRIMQFSDDIGRTSRDVMNDVGNLGATFRVMGFSAEEAFRMSQGMVLLADSMQTLRPDLEYEASLDILRSTIRGTSKDLLQFNIVMTEAERQTYAIAKGLYTEGAAWDAVTNQIVNYNILMEKFGSWANENANNPTGDYSVLKNVSQATEKDAAKIEKTLAGLGLASFDKLNNVKDNPAADMSDSMSNLTDQFDLWSEFTDALFYSNEQLRDMGETMDEITERGFWTKLSDGLGWAYGKIADGGGWLWSHISDLGGAAWAHISDAGGRAWAVISEGGGDTWRKISEWGGDAWSKISDWGGKAWSSISNAATTAWNAISGGLTPIWEAMTNIAGGIKDTILGVFESLKKAIKGIVDWIFGILGEVKNAAKSVIDGIPIIGDIAHGLGDAWGGVTSFLGLADGGVALPRHPGLVAVGDNMSEPEIVAPQSYVQKAVEEAMVSVQATSIGGGGDVLINSPIVLDGVTVGRLTSRYVRMEQDRVSGGSVIGR